MKPLDREGRTDLHYAARDGDLASVQKLIAQDKRGWAPLHFAAQARSEEVSKCLFAHGASVDSADSFGNTPLATATFNSRGDGSVIRVLRAAGADPKRKNKSGVSAVSLARTIANFDVAQFYDVLNGAEQVDTSQRRYGVRRVSKVWCSALLTNLFLITCIRMY